MNPPSSGSLGILALLFGGACLAPAGYVFYNFERLSTESVVQWVDGGGGGGRRSSPPRVTFRGGAFGPPEDLRENRRNWATLGAVLAAMGTGSVFLGLAFSWSNFDWRGMTALAVGWLGFVVIVQVRYSLHPGVGILPWLLAAFLIVVAILAYRQAVEDREKGLRSG